MFIQVELVDEPFPADLAGVGALQTVLLNNRGLYIIYIAGVGALQTVLLNTGVYT